jgi:multisubunit Na+/H+ antiporter MnhB subunit
LDYPRRDPVDYERTTRQHAGESLNNGANAPGLAGIAIGAVALIMGLFALATGHVAVGSVAVFLAAVLGATGAGWLMYAHRQVRKAEQQQWEATHYDGPAPPPSS